MDFYEYLQITAGEINYEIDDFFRDWNKYVLGVNPKLIALNKFFAEHCDGGKRLRGVLVKLGFELAGGGENKEILKPASAFEIFQTAILAQDDVIDKSPTRRGRPSIYQALGGDHYGISQTICLGDLGFFLAEKLIQESGFSLEVKNKALASFTQTVLDTALGEMLDVELARSGDGREEDILTIFRLKTAHYTVVGPLHLGAILGGADRKLLGELEALGEKLGIAFQIQDDILGVFGDEATLGKSVSSDIEEGKQTLLVSYALAHADKIGREVLGRYYGRGKVDDKALTLVREVFVKSGALKYSQNMADRLVAEAKTIIDRMDVPAGKGQLLSEMSDYIINRPK